MTWQTPELHDINMASEIGAYQDEFDPDRDPRFVSEQQVSEDARESDAP